MSKTVWNFLTGWRWKNLSNRQKLIMLYFMFGLLLTFGVMLLSFRSIGPPLITTHPPRWSVDDLTKQGDHAFRASLYTEALRLYKKADGVLDAQIKFEDESPSRSVAVLQRHYNSKTFIKTRIKLALIADDISRMEHSPLLQ